MDRQDNEQTLPEGWKTVGSSGALYRKFEFESYDGTSAFLEKLAALSEETGIYPDLSFASKHVNVTVHAPGDDEEPGPRHAFAAQAATFVTG